MLFFDEGKQRKGCEVLLPLWTSVNDAPFPTEKTSKIARNLPKYLRYSRQKMNTLNKKSRKTPNKKSSFKKKTPVLLKKSNSSFFGKTLQINNQHPPDPGTPSPFWRLFQIQVLCLQRICNERHETWRSNHSSWEGHGNGLFVGWFWVAFWEIASGGGEGP